METHPVAVVLAVIFIAAPCVLAIAVDRRVASFQRQAFGHLARAARNLRIMTWAIWVYYVGVLVGSWIIGDLAAMFVLPMPAEGVQIYVRIGAAAMAYVFALFVARELYLVTQPRKA